MYCKSLMIGDKVFIAGSPTRTIKHLTKRKVGYIANDTETRVYYTHPEFVFGIPLTPEILEKNGFIFNSDDSKWIMQVMAFIIKVDDGEFWLFDGYVEIHYVHELQHALKLYGLNDLADNFKV